MIIEDNRLLLKYNLQLFAEGDSGEKTEEPTPKRKEKAREEGQVAKSNEVTTALLLIVTFALLKYYGPSVVDKINKLFETMYRLFDRREITVAFASELMEYVVLELIDIMLPILLAVFAIALFSNFIQVGWHPTTKPLIPKLSNMNPINGVKRLFSLRSVIELIKSLLKIAIISAIIYFSIRQYSELILIIYDISLFEAYGLIANICLDIGIKVGGFFVIIAIIDYIYQRYSLNKKLKMTKQEIKEEYKQSEGNPEIKSKIKQKMREAATRRMMQDLPNADVIITNPTHFAVGIQYDPNNADGSAPRVIAKGADIIAAKIREKAKEHAIEIVENKPLARALYYTVEIGEEIPPELYQAVAEILAFVYSLSRSKHEQKHQVAQ